MAMVSSTRIICVAVLAGLMAASPVLASVKRITEGKWIYVESIDGSPPTALFRGSDLQGYLSYLKDKRQWLFSIAVDDDTSSVSEVTLRAVYDADASRNRAHRVEETTVKSRLIKLQPLKDELGRDRPAPSPVVQTTLPRTFIVHLQGADRVEISAGAIHRIIGMNGSAKAIAQIYTSIGEGSGGEGKTIAEMVGGTPHAAASKPEAPTPPAVQAAKPREPSKKPNPRPECKLLPDSDLGAFGACVDQHVDDIEAAYAETGDEVAREQLKRNMVYTLSYNMGRYIKQKYSRMPHIELCTGFAAPYGSPREVQTRAVTQEINCLVEERDQRRETIKSRFEEARAVMRMDYLGDQGLDELNRIYDLEMDNFAPYQKMIQTRLREARSWL